MGITLGQLSGTMQAHLEGSSLLAMQIGFNARNAIVSCDMAAHGFTGPRAVLDGPYGYFPLFETASDSTATTADVGRIWRISEVSHKPFPSGRATHGIVDGVLRLRDQHGFDTADIDKVVASVPPLIAQLVGRPLTTNMSVNYARLCARFVTARALLSGTVGLADFAPDALHDRTSLDLADKIDIGIDANPGTNALTPITVEITLDSGSSHSVTVQDVYGGCVSKVVEIGFGASPSGLSFAAVRPRGQGFCRRLADRGFPIHRLCASGFGRKRGAPRGASALFRDTAARSVF